MKTNPVKRFSPELTTGQVYAMLFEFYKTNDRQCVPPYAMDLGENHLEVCYKLAILSASNKYRDIKEQINKLGGFKVVVDEIVRRAAEEYRTKCNSGEYRTKRDSEVLIDVKAVKKLGIDKYLQELADEKAQRDEEAAVKGISCK